MHFFVALNQFAQFPPMKAGEKIYYVCLFEYSKIRSFQTLHMGNFAHNDIEIVWVILIQTHRQFTACLTDSAVKEGHQQLADKAVVLSKVHSFQSKLSFTKLTDNCIYGCVQA